MDRELRPLVRARRLQPVALRHLSAWRAGTIVAVAVGMGPAAARLGTRQVLEEFHPDRVLVTGVAGAVAPMLSVGDVVVPETVLDASSGDELHPHGVAAGRRGTLVTVDRLGAPAPAGSLAIDMETAAIAAECEDAGIPWDVRRAVSDVPGTLPVELGSLVRPDGRTNRLAVVRLLVGHPGAVAVLVHVGRDARRAVDAATGAVLRVLDELDELAGGPVPPGE